MKSCNINLLSLAVNLLLWNTVGPVIGSDSNIDEANPLFNPFADSKLASTTFRLSYFLNSSVLIDQQAGLGGHGKSRPSLGFISGPYSRDSSVHVATVLAGWTVRVLSPVRVKKFLSSRNLPDRLLGQHSLLFTYRGSFPR